MHTDTAGITRLTQNIMLLANVYILMCCFYVQTQQRRICDLKERHNKHQRLSITKRDNCVSEIDNKHKERGARQMYMSCCNWSLGMFSDVQNEW